MPLPGFSKAGSSSKEKAFAAPDFRSVQDAIVGLYQQKIKDLEESTLYHNFGSAPLSPGEVKARPMVLLIGQYSTGKTTFIRHLLGRDFPHMHIGPEPTTDGFMAIVKGHHEAPRSIPGNAATSDNNYPFQALSKFGAGFMNRFCVVRCAWVYRGMLWGVVSYDAGGDVVDGFAFARRLHLRRHSRHPRR